MQTTVRLVEGSHPNGERNAESAALGSGVLQSEAPAVQLGNRTCNCKAQTRSAQPIRAYARIVDTKEPFKDPRLKLIGNAATCVGDRNLDAGGDLLEPHIYCSAF